MPRPDENDFLMRVLGQKTAIEFCRTLFRISQVLDDLVDRDKPVAPDAVFRAFWEALIDLPGNPFYRQHEPVLRPMMAAALQDWWDATRMEQDGDLHGRHLAFVLRDMLTGIVIQCAGIVGGWEWMQSVSVEIRRHFHEDELIDYLNDLEVRP